MDGPFQKKNKKKRINENIRHIKYGEIKYY